jgi:hypothetical protein
MEDDLKASLINCLADVYRKAKAVVILDARCTGVAVAECGVWSVELVHVAMVLYCGGKLLVSPFPVLASALEEQAGVNAPRIEMVI